MVLAVNYPAEVPVGEGVFPFLWVDKDVAGAVQSDCFSGEYLLVGWLSYNSRVVVVVEFSVMGSGVDG